jgi:hypothetical protein
VVKDRGRPSRLCKSEMVYNCDCRLMTYAVAMLAPDLKNFQGDSGNESGRKWSGRNVPCNEKKDFRSKMME